MGSPHCRKRWLSACRWAPPKRSAKNWHSRGDPLCWASRRPAGDCPRTLSPHDRRRVHSLGDGTAGGAALRAAGRRDHRDVARAGQPQRGQGSAYVSLRAAVPAPSFLAGSTWTGWPSTSTPAASTSRTRWFVAGAAWFDVVEVSDPVIVVEVISPSTHKVDTTQKLADYFRIPSVRHYLIVNTSRRAVVHHERGATAALGPVSSYRAPEA